jgi:sulfatase maturation enzyme AslB (radical SAM superfamily)
MLYRHPRYVEHLLFTKLRSLSRYRWAERNADCDGKVPPPLGYKVVLTYKCNLRCTMCYQWGDVGWCHEQENQPVTQELDWAVLERLFRETANTRPYFIFIGGEPTLYSRFKDLAELTRAYKCFSITCTNGMSLHKLTEVVEANRYLTFLVSLDGLQAENDKLRGRGVFLKVTENIRRMKRLKKPPYIGVEFTIRPENVAVMYDFCEEMVRVGVDWLIFNPCWFISERQARNYELFMESHFSISPKTYLGYQMPYDLDKDKFIEQMTRINSRRWPIQISSLLQKPADILT